MTQEAEIELTNEMQAYREVLDGDSSDSEAETQRKKDIFREIDGMQQKTDEEQRFGQERQLLEDFYKEMNLDV